MSFEQLMARLNEEIRKQPDADCIHNAYASINMNAYQMALRDVLVERKETIRANFDHSMYFPHNSVYTVSEILSANLDNPTLHLTEDERKDEEIIEMERNYQMRVRMLKQRLEKNLAYVDEKNEKYQKKMREVLDEQMKFRPIDQIDLNRASDTIKYTHDRIRNETREVATNSIMIMMNQINEARKRRRNFTKESTDRLQEFFNRTPYPSESEKEALAIDCNITVQQVANWFGNRRIRMKRGNKNFAFDGESRSFCNPDGSIEYISPCKDFGMNESLGNEIPMSSSNDVLDISNYTRNEYVRGGK